MPALGSLLDRPSTWTGLDSLAARVTDVVHRVVGDGRTAGVLHGRPFSHSSHPVLAQVPVGSAISAATLDLLSVLAPDPVARQAFQRSARALTAVGVASAAPTALTGWTDFADLHEDQQRTGLVHAIGNVAAIVLWTASLVQPRRRRTLATVGTLVAGGSAALGGHLAHRWAAGTHHAEHVPHVAPEGWYQLCELQELTERRPQPARIGPVGVVVVRTGDDVRAFADACSHLSGLLHEGEVRTFDGQDCVVCPWHGSAFRLDDGEVVRGPATAPQPRVEVVVRDGDVWGSVVRLPGSPGRPPLPGTRTDRP